MTFEQWLQSLTTEQRFDFDSEGRGYPKDRGHMMRLAWNAATAPLLERIAKQQARIDQLVQEVAAGADAEAAQRERIAELEAKLAQRVPDGWVMVPPEPTKEMLDAMVSSAWLPGCYRTLLSASPAAPEQQDPKKPTISLELPDGDTRTIRIGWSEWNPSENRLHLCVCVNDATPEQVEAVAQAPNAQQAEAQEPFGSRCFTCRTHKQK